MKTPILRLRRALVALACAAVATIAAARITPGPLFRDGAVLQREQPLPVWGRANPGEQVRVDFHGQSKTITADANGRWSVTLAPEKASAEAAELVLTGENTVRVRDVLVGDVWLCSGQSNMEFRVRQADNAEQEMAAANLPTIRQFKIPHLVSDKPQDDCPGEWVRCSPETVGDFTAVGYFFARDVQRQFGVPIGLINSSWGGTFIEGWMSPESLQADPAHAAIMERWQKVLADFPAKQAAYEKATAKWRADAAAAKAAGKAFNRRAPVAAEGPGSRWLPSGMYNAMIAPLTPARIRGALWYQGETNAGRAVEYRSLFPGMIKQWRTAFGNAELPFYFVQLANFQPGGDASGEQWAFLREAQTGALALPLTGMAVTIDIGIPKNIHPTNKQEVGRRLALWTRSQLFGEKLEYTGPVFSAAQIDGATVRVRFTHAAGLTLREAGAPSFAVAGADRKFVPAKARVDGDTLVITADGVAHPVAVRYAWSNSPAATLYNGAGLPASPFRSDSW